MSVYGVPEVQSHTLRRDSSDETDNEQLLSASEVRASLSMQRKCMSLHEIMLMIVYS